MTMQKHHHPDDERLAALAGGDPEAAADAALRAHVASCDRCGGLVDDLGQLRAALSELPDLAPTRPIQLIPPVPAPDQQQGPARWLRTLTGPVMAAGAGLALVGAVGLGSLAVGGMATGGALFQNIGTDLEGAAAPSAAASAEGLTNGEDSLGRSSPMADAHSSPQTPAHLGAGHTASPVPTVSPTSSPVPEIRSGDTGNRSAQPLALTDTSTPLPWLTLLLVGGALLVIGLVLRFSIRPRAG